MAAFAFVLFFLLLGLGALFLGMRGGPRAARERQASKSRRGRRGATLLFVLTILVLGVAVPAAVIATEKSRDSIPEANVKALTATQEHGRELFAQRCKNCHTLAAAKATAQVGPNLDELAPAQGAGARRDQQGPRERQRQHGRRARRGQDAEAVAQFVAVAVGNPAK